MKVGPEPFGFELEIGSWKLGGPKLAVVSRQSSVVSRQSSVGSCKRSVVSRKFQVVRR